MSNGDTYSGKFLVRIPPYLHERLAKVASDQGVSMNTLIQASLTETITRLTAERKIKRLQQKSQGEK